MMLKLESIVSITDVIKYYPSRMWTVSLIRKLSAKQLWPDWCIQMSWNQSAQSQLNEAETDSKTRSDLNDVFRKSEADREKRVCGTSVTSVLSVVLSVHSGVLCSV